MREDEEKIKATIHRTVAVKAQLNHDKISGIINYLLALVEWITPPISNPLTGICLCQ